ncbi:MAG TPA: cupin domain-containing protein [Polyangiaceae bacterium]|jgi:anti-sigma factor ChrR (cupin superfamily)|nr:cupin domain-containing protein [Polyangiaceae bacterium]
MKQSDDVLSEFLSESERGELEALADLSQALEARAPAGSARSRLLARAKSPGLRWAPHFDKLAALFDLSEPALTEIAERSSQEQHWEQLPLSGVRLFHLQGGPTIAGADAGLVAIRAGTQFPHHRHGGEERTLVLEGALREADGTLLGPGDAQIKHAGSSHSFTVLEGASLIYAVVLFAPIEIDGARFPPAR